MVSYQFLMKKKIAENVLVYRNQFVSLHRKTEMKCSIGLWCNGNTTDSKQINTSR